MENDKSNSYKEKLLSKYSKYDLQESDLDNLKKTFNEFLLEQIEDRDKIIQELSNAFKIGKNIDDSEVKATIEKYRLLKVS
ncbi:hypothetical protein [Aquimarina algiphila]|uniref:Uncharacterized protein n=1 Tax=Aquimarina algiphila TaxID=2047982 RepID=A0A554VBL8_9FLAO|nr:hypothetical protein [Aquimarina algiphila]TSE03966.1 hypothetical protein FOF46_27885 [Aquimarina algiphila]